MDWAQTRPILSAMSGRTITWRWPTCASRSTARPARATLRARRTSTRSGPGSAATARPRTPATPSSLHDQLADRWILTQFTPPARLSSTAWPCPPPPTRPGTYFRYAFPTASLPRLSEVRRVARRLLHQHAGVRGRRAVRRLPTRSTAPQLLAGNPRPRSSRSSSARRPGGTLQHRRRLAAHRHRRLDPAPGGQPELLRRHDGPGRTLWRAPGRAHAWKFHRRLRDPGQLHLHPDEHPSRRSVRLDLPLLPELPRVHPPAGTTATEVDHPRLSAAAAHGGWPTGTSGRTSRW